MKNFFKNLLNAMNPFAPVKKEAKEVQMRPPQTTPDQKIDVEGITVEYLFKAYLKERGIDGRKISPHRLQDLRLSHSYAMGQLLVVQRDVMKGAPSHIANSVYTKMLRECQLVAAHYNKPIDSIHESATENEED